MKPPLFEPCRPDRVPEVRVIADLALNHDGAIARAESLIASAEASGADGIALALPGPAHCRLELEDLEELREEVGEAGMYFLVRAGDPGGLEAAGTLEADLVLATCSALALRGGYDLEPTCPLAFGFDAADGTTPGEEAVSGGARMLFHAAREPKPGLAALSALTRRWPLAVGLIDPTTSLVTGAVAVALGASVLVKGFTEVRTASGPTHASSLDPVHFTHYAELARDAARMIGPAVNT